MGPVPGAAATESIIAAQGLLPGTAGKLIYWSYQQLVEIDPGGTIGRILGPNDLRFDLADGGDRRYEIWAATSDSNGNIYLLEWRHKRLLRLAPNGAMSAISLPRPKRVRQLQLAATSDGIVYLSGADSIIQRIDFATSTVTIIAGNGEPGYLVAPDGSPATSIAIDPSSIAVGDNNVLYILDHLSIRRINSEGKLRTVADLGQLFFGVGTVGPLIAAPDGTLLAVSDRRVARLDPRTGIVSAVANGKALYIGGVFRFPVSGIGLLQDPGGTIYVSEPTLIRIIDDARADISSYAGTGAPSVPDGPIPASLLQLRFPYGVAAGPDNTLYISEPQDQRIRTVDPKTRISTTVPAYTGLRYVPALSTAIVDFPPHIAVGPDGGVFFNEACRLNRMSPSTGQITTIAGSTTCGKPFGMIGNFTISATGDIFLVDDSIWRIDGTSGATNKVIDVQDLAVYFPHPDWADSPADVHLAADSSANVYFSGGYNGGLLKITPVGAVSLFAGDPNFIFDPGASEASLQILDMAVATDGLLYASLYDSVIAVDLNTAQITPIAGSPRLDLPYESGDGGPALDARLSAYFLATGGGSIYVMDEFFVRRIYHSESKRAIQ